MTEDNTWHTTYAICPYCGYEDQDSWEIGHGEECDTETDCASCGRTFQVSRHISVTYTTKRMEP